MSTETSTPTGTDTEGAGVWIAGGLGGIAGGVVFGLMLQGMMRPVLAGAIPALWGLSGLPAGWVVHLVNSAVLGLLFAAVVEATGLEAYAGEIRSGWAPGLAWGLVLWVVGAALVMPLWLAAVGFPQAPPFPNLSPQSIPGHAVYGVVLGLVYAFVRSR